MVSPERRQCWSEIGTGSSLHKETFSIWLYTKWINQDENAKALREIQTHSSQPFADVSTWRRGVLTGQKSEKGLLCRLGHFLHPPTLEGSLACHPLAWVLCSVCSHRPPHLGTCFFLCPEFFLCFLFWQVLPTQLLVKVFPDSPKWEGPVRKEDPSFVFPSQLFPLCFPDPFLMLLLHPSRQLD